MLVEFLKYHGCGNDFIIIDEVEKEIVPENMKGRLSKSLCMRRFSIGANDVLYVTSSDKADAGMRVFEPDGSEADMCGNGLRCLASYVCDKLKKNDILIETKAGVKHIIKDEDFLNINMGKLLIKKGEMNKFVRIDLPLDKELIDISISFPGLEAPLRSPLQLSIVNTGEPHIVIFVDEVDNENIETYGKMIARNKNMFPYGININLVQIVDKSSIKVRTYERGVWDETFACGTGATASAAVSYLTGRVKDRKVKIKMIGGTLFVEINSDKTLSLIGPAVKVFKGEYDDFTLNL